MLRNSLISGTSFFVGGAVSKGVEAAITNTWGLTHYDASGMAKAIFISAGIQSAYGFGMGLVLPIFKNNPAKKINWGDQWLKGGYRGVTKGIDIIAKKPWVESD
jgi:hypothetical protein